MVARGRYATFSTGIAVAHVDELSAETKADQCGDLRTFFAAQDL